MPDLFIAHDRKPYKNALKHVTLSEHKSSVIGPFNSFCPMPDDITFSDQEAGERIILFLRRHFATNLRWVIFTLLLLLLPLVIWLTFSSVGFSLPPRLTVILLSFYYLVLFGYALIQYTLWFYHAGIVTDLRVIDIDVININNTNVAATGIHDIVDVEYSDAGFLRSFFNYGDVHMQTEGLKPNFEFHAVPMPAKVADAISDLIRGGEK